MTVFYRKYRPQRFAEIIGQEHIKKALLGQLGSGKVSHGFLFAGPRGTGKTSMARILAKAVNCHKSDVGDQKSDKSKSDIRSLKSEIKFGEPCNKCTNCVAITNGSSLDLIEIDAASNRGIDEIRDLREKIKFSPVSSRFKVYIIDEVHMLTNEAFNALLKTLEEPPAHAIFILCTTEPNKLPETIISRLIRFNFSRANTVDVSEFVLNIAKAEKLRIEKSAILAIAKAADGSFRDSASILEQLSALKGIISEDDVTLVVKASGWSQILEILGFLIKRDLRSSVSAIERLEGHVDYSKLTADMISVLKDMLFVKIGVSKNDTGDQQKFDQIYNLSGEVNLSDLKNLVRLLLIAESEMKIYPMAQIPLILAFCDYCGEQASQSEAKTGGDYLDKKAVKESEEKIDDKAKKPEEDAKAGQDPPKSLDEVEAKWGKFLEKVKPVNAHVVALLKSTRPSLFNGRILTLEVFFRFHKDKLEEPKIMTILCDTISEVMGKKVTLKFVLADRNSRAPKAVRESDVLDIEAGGLTKAAQEIFAK